MYMCMAFARYLLYGFIGSGYFYNFAKMITRGFCCYGAFLYRAENLCKMKDS